MSGGFAGGLAEGLNQGMQMYSLHENIKSRAKADERADAANAREEQAHAMKQKELADVRNMTEGWAKELGWNPEMAGGSPTRPDAPSMGAPQPADTPSAIGLGGPAPMGTPSAAGLQAPTPAQQPQQAPISAGEYVQKHALQGDAFSDPERLNKMAAIAFANNQGAMGIQFLNQVHTATKQGWGKALASLASGDGKGAAEVLKKNGMDIEGDLTPVEGKEHTWKGKINGREAEISAKDLFMSANPEEAYKLHLQGKENARKAEMEERKHTLDVEKLENEKRETSAKIGLLGARGALARAQAKAAGEKGGLKSTKSSAKDIGAAITRQDNQFKQLSTVKDADGEETVDNDLRRKYENAATTLQSIIEDESGEELDHRQIYKVTQEVMRMDLAKWGPAEMDAGIRKAVRRFGLDGSIDEPKESKDPQALGGKKQEAKPAAAGLKPKKEPTREEQELDAVRFNEADRRQMRELQVTRTASNLSSAERKEVDEKIASLLEKNKPKGSLKTSSRNRSPSSDPEVAPAGYGKRQDGTEKGTGWLGVHKSTKGHDMTEYTVGLNINGKDVDVPTFVPGLTDKELAHLKTEPDFKERSAINESILRKAADHARKRMREGKSVFADK